MKHVPAWVWAALLSLFVAACASSGATTSGLTTAAVEDEDFDCGKLTGKMQIRILELRSQHASQRASGMSVTMESIIKPIMGGGTPVDADARVVADLKQLKLDNEKLIANDCAAFDLEKELSARPSAPAPRVIPRETAKSKS